MFCEDGQSMVNRANRLGNGSAGKPFEQDTERRPSMQTRPMLLAAAAILAFAAPAAAQNTTEPPVVAPPPPAKTETPPATTAPPTTTPAPAETPAAPPPVVVVPQTQPAPMEPVTINPDAAYPNGFADPADPFANDMSLAYREQGGFDWGLLGLLGLLGLIPLFRQRERYARTVYVERDDEAVPRRVVRKERIDEG
jgi:hypothetical protein